MGDLVAYIVCDKFLMKEEQIPSNVVQPTTSNQNAEVKEVKPVENSYQIYAENLKKERAQFDDYNYSTMRYYNSMAEVPFYDISLKGNGDLYYNSQKLVSHILNYFVTYDGNGGLQRLYFIYEDGKVGSADIEESYLNNEEITITSDLGYSDIVTILGGVFGEANAPGYHGPIFVDIHGNMFHE